MSRREVFQAKADHTWAWLFRRLLGRATREFIADDIPTVAAGATFYLLLAFFPALVAFVSLYGLFADVATVREHLAYLRDFLPRSTLQFLGEEMLRVANAQTASLSWTFVLSLLISIWSANAGIGALIGGLNVAYEQKERRGFLAGLLLSLVITVGALVAAIAAVILVVAVPLAMSALGLEEFDLLEFLRWPLLFAATVGALAVLYKYGPYRRRGARRPVMVGALFAASVWLLSSLAFSYYLGNFANYDRTYGSLGSIMGFMMWIWLGQMVVLFGAELNNEIERLG